MKLLKSLVLGSAAALTGLTGAQAADLPAAEAVEYVKVCDTFGAGFFYIPGSDTCLQIGGFARLEMTYAETSDDDDANRLGMRVRTRVWFDARTSTEYGTVRAYVRLQFQRETGARGSAATTNGDLTADDALFDKAFVQFGGLTAGVTDSFWDFKPYPTFQNPFISDRTVPVLAYTAEFGTGFSASVSLEDTSARYRSNARAADFGGQELPHLVGNLRVQQGWGEAQISGLVFDVNPSEGLGGSNKTGWGVQGGVKFKLDSLAKGDYVWASAAYVEGNLSYLGIGDANVGSGQTQNIVNFNPQRDFNIVDGRTKLTTGWNANLGLQHYWSPKWRSAVQGTYIDINDRRRGADWKAYSVAGNLIWTPVKKLDIGGELVYVNTDFANQGFLTRPRKDDDAFVGRIRVQRDF